MSQATRSRPRRFNRREAAPADAAPARIGPLQLTSGAAALVALVSSAIAVGFTLWPSLKPDPGDVRGARATVVAVERNVSVHEWLLRSSATPEEARERERKWQADAGDTTVPGILAYVRVSMHGFKHQPVHLIWAIYNRDTKERLEETAVDGGPPTEIGSTAPADELVVEQPLALVPGPTVYFVRAEIRAEDGTLLDIADSAPFEGL